MKINFTQRELFQIVQAYLGTRGMVVQAEAEGLFEVTQEDDGQLCVSVEADFAPAAREAVSTVRNQGRPVVTERRTAPVDHGSDPRTRVIPRPGGEDDGEGQEEGEQGPPDMRGVLAASQAIERVGPVKASVPARARFPRTQMGQTIEELGKRSDDTSDEIA
jgi:hypothetical protein